MNKKIKDFVILSTIIEEHGWGATSETIDRDKFAELIVLECANQLSDDKRKILLDHFGIKQ